MSKSFNELKPKLISLGFAFYGESSSTHADPEKTIIELIPTILLDDGKLFKLLLRWLITVNHLIHVERLFRLSEDLLLNDKILLGVLALKLEKYDKRWGLISEKLIKFYKKTRGKPPLDGSFKSKYLINKYGIDEEFRKIGVSIYNLAPSDEKKIFSLEKIIGDNRWFKIRALIGANYRADMVYIISEKLVKNPNQAIKFLRCSRETAYRLYKNIDFTLKLGKLTI